MEYVKLSLREYESLKREAERHEEAYKTLKEYLEDSGKMVHVCWRSRWDSGDRYVFSSDVKDEIESLRNEIDFYITEMKKNWKTRLKEKLCNFLNCDCK